MRKILVSPFWFVACLFLMGFAVVMIAAHRDALHKLQVESESVADLQLRLDNSNQFTTACAASNRELQAWKVEAESIMLRAVPALDLCAQVLATPVGKDHRIPPLYWQQLWRRNEQLPTRGSGGTGPQ